MKKSILIIWFKLIYRLMHFTLNIYLKASDVLEANKIKKPHVSTKIDMSYRRMFFIDCLVALNRGRVLTNTVNKIVYRNKIGK